MASNTTTRNDILKDVCKKLNAKLTSAVNANSIIDVLFAEDILSDADNHALREIQQRQEKTGHLLALLHLQNHPRAFIVLREALQREKAYHWIVEEVDCLYKQLAGNKVDVVAKQQQQHLPATVNKPKETRAAASKKSDDASRATGGQQQQTRQTSETVNPVDVVVKHQLKPASADKQKETRAAAEMKTKKPDKLDNASQPEKAISIRHLTKFWESKMATADNVTAKATTAVSQPTETRAAAEMKTKKPDDASRATGGQQTCQTKEVRRVEVDYEAKDEHELTIRVSDVITDVQPLSDGWSTGLLRGKRGAFPDNHATVIITEFDNSQRATKGKLTVISSDGAVTGVTSLNGRLYVARFRHSDIAVYEAATFTFQKHIAVGGIGNFIARLASCASNNCLYVSDYDRQIVHRVELSAANRAVTWGTDGYGHPIGLSVNSSSNVIVTILCFEDDKKGEKIKEVKILEYTTRGQLLRAISLQLDSMDIPWHAIQLSSDQFVYCHGRFKLLQVCIVDSNGRIVAHSRKRSKNGELSGPMHLAIDKNGFIFAADCENRRIVVLKHSLSSLSFSHYLPVPVEDGLQGPLALHLDESRDRLYVGEVGKRVLIIDEVSRLVQQ